MYDYRETVAKSPQMRAILARVAKRLGLTETETADAIMNGRDPLLLVPVVDDLCTSSKRLEILTAVLLAVTVVLVGTTVALLVHG